MSDSRSISRSRSPSESSYSDSRSRSRSRSRSPFSSRHGHRSKKYRSRHRHEKTRHEKPREKVRERKSGHHSKQKRKRHLSPDAKEKESKSRHSKSRRIASLEKKKHRDHLTPSSVVDSVLSPDSSLGTLTPEVDGEPQVKSLSYHKHHHKRRSKASHRHKAGRDKMMDVNFEGGDQEINDSAQPGSSVDQTMEEIEHETNSQDVNNGGKVATGVGIQDNPGEVKSGTEEANIITAEGTSSKLVPYLDSSATEVECMDESNAVGDEQCTAGSQTGTKPTVEEENLLGEAVDSRAKCDGEESIKKGGQEENDPMEDSLMISLHVDDTIDDGSTELLDAECPVKTGKSNASTIVT